MKKLLLLSFMTCSFSFLNAQESETGFSSGSAFGVKGGFASISHSVGNFSVSESTFFVGAFMEFGINEKFAIQPELTYSLADEVHYIHLPVLAKYHIIEGLYGQAGPQLTYVGVSGAESFEDDGFNDIGLDLVIGAGYNITDQISADLTYSFGITNRVSEDEGFGESLDYNINALHLGIGYRF